ncbi:MULTISPECIES: GNAT family N-acetyltransferase [unclassified Variovorax]|jgi:ribosomal protein S18 acetylase RimI-like enzyme|uniref:GNAT family N-acetyltransferase n=1 Tax=unclassified Variovorax TaxID=663243 RepID=UPI00197D49BD|nr:MULTISPECIES: GNAT family N-acetyltransferase [unclassified Variovorax]
MKSKSPVVRPQMRRAAPEDPTPWALLLAADGPRAEIRKYLSRGELWLAEAAGQVVGQMVLLETRVGTWEIMNIGVSDELRGRGVGTALLRKASALAAERGANRLEVGTGNSSLRELAFYQRFGFRIVGVDTDFFVRRANGGRLQKQNGIVLRDMVRMRIEFES